MSDPATARRQGALAAALAFGMWGFFPLYWHMLAHVPSLQIIAHRIVWCAAFVLVWLSLSSGRGWLRSALDRPRVGLMLVASSLLIGLNWGIYIWAVTHERVVAASLGYFINPLLNVVLGVALLGERLNRAQQAAVALAALGVLWLAVQHDEPPWLSLALAASFATYGLIRKLAVVDAIPGLAIESLVLVAPSLGWIAWEQHAGRGAFSTHDPRTAALLVLGGVITSVPLIAFAFAARRLPYSLLGFLQYLAPTLQLLCGVWVLGEAFSGVQLVGFGLIWAALAVYLADSLRRAD